MSVHESNMTGTSPTPPIRESVVWADNPRTFEEFDLTIYYQIACKNPSISRQNVGWVVGDYGEYLDEYKEFEMEIPSTYSDWREEYETDMGGRAFGGVVKDTRYDDGSTYYRCSYPEKLVKGAHKILTGGGNYKADEFTLHIATPFAVLEGPEDAVIISPYKEFHEVSEDDEPDITL